MSQGIVNVNLRRDGPSTAWGFRLQGGRDVGCPLTIQRVFLGSPSESELHRGDVILRIGDRDANRLTHMEAHDIIKHSGNALSLIVQRIPGAPFSPAGTPTSISPVGSGHPLANAIPTTQVYRPPTPPHASHHRTIMGSKIAQPVPQPWSKTKNYIFSPLPTTPVPPAVDRYQGYLPEPQQANAAEEMEFKEEKTKEKQAIVHQGYRTFPLISPKPKTRHDLPTGSYLRHVQDPTWKPSSPPRPAMHTEYLVTPVAAVSPHDSMQVDYNSDGPKIVHRQYNSPLPLYSSQNIAETITEQIGVQPSSQSPNQPTSATAAATTAPGAITAKAGTKIHNIADITLSPTFRLIQEEEGFVEDGRKQESKSPIATPSPPRPNVTRVYNPPPAPHLDYINSFGMPKEKIHQSGSFKTLMSSLLIHSEF